MRTTLEIDDSVLAAAKALARDEGTSIGAVISRLARSGLATPARTSSGFPVFAVQSSVDPITLDVVNEHRDS